MRFSCNYLLLGGKTTVLEILYYSLNKCLYKFTSFKIVTNIKKYIIFNAYSSYPFFYFCFCFLQSKASKSNKIRVVVSNFFLKEKTGEGIFHYET